MKVLGIHGVGHDSGVCVVEDGHLLYSIETERLTRLRFDHRVDIALSHVFRQPGCSLEEIDLVALSTPLGHRSIQVSGREDVMQRLSRREELHVETSCLMEGREKPCLVVTHEASHAMLAVHYAAYRDGTLALVNEGQGQFSQNALFVFRAGSLEWVDLDFLPWYGRGLGWSGLGVLFHMGNGPGVAGKLMAMGGYGTFSEDLAARLIGIEDRVTTDRGYADSVAERLWGEGFCDGFQRQADIIATFQHLFTGTVVETAVSRMALHDCSTLALGGGCALNIVTNTALRTGPGIDPAVPPACNDAGHPLGVAAYAHLERTGSGLHPFSVYSGGATESDVEAAEAFRAAGLEPRSLDLDHVVETLAGGGVVAFQQGRSESGPRALGHRSLLANPEHPGTRQIVSERLKQREWYRPLAAVVTEKTAAQLLPGQPMSPYMLFDYDLPGQVMKEARHVNGTSRLQTVSSAQNPVLHEVLTRMREHTGVPGLINTSLNAAGRAIAQSCDDMLIDFLRTDVRLFVNNGAMARQEGL